MKRNRTAYLRMRRSLSKKCPYRQVRYVLAAVVTVLSFFPFTLAAEDSEFSKLNRELSLGYTEMIHNGGGPEHLQGSSDFIENALVFWPRNPDALYYKALLLVREHNYDEAIELLTDALSGVPFRYGTRDTALRLYLELLVQNDKSDLALAVLSSLETQKIKQQEFLELKVHALKNRGLIPTLTGFVDTGVSLFPGNDFFQSLQVVYSPTRRYEVRQKILAEPDQKLFGQMTLKETIRKSVVTSQLRNLLEIYRKRWGEDIFFLAQSLRTLDRPVLEDLEDIFQGDRRIPGDLLMLIHDEAAKGRDTKDGDQDIFSAAFRKFNGSILRDPDDDDIFEVEEYYRNGTPLRVEANLDGDPGFELVITFREGKPESISMPGFGGDRLEAEYRVYPELGRVLFPAGDGTVMQVQPAPYSLRFPIEGFEGYFPPEPIPFPRIECFPPMYRILSDAVKIESMNDRSVITRFYRERRTIEKLHEGVVEMRADLDGSMIERRRRDPDLDGFFEIEEFYRDGALIMIGYDGNRNGVFEYIEEFEPLNIRKWDTDEDGIADYHEK